MISALLWLSLAGAPKNEPLVEAKDAVPDLVVDLRYATADNFMKLKVYPDSAKCLLMQSATSKLQAAAKTLKAKGYRLKVWDCYRPLSVQFELWKVFPKPGYVADPNKKGSLHNRGAAVDLTLVTADGGEVEMPTPYDNFTRAAHHAFDGGTSEAMLHRTILLEAMEGAGFKRNPMEWWHYELPGAIALPARDEPFK
jgi:zinc D-Ala-D-Ala dipeptidase